MKKNVRVIFSSYLTFEQNVLSLLVSNIGNVPQVCTFQLTPPLPSPDESGVCLNAVARTKGWAPIGERTRRVPTQRATQKFNVIPAISTSGLVAHMIQEESVTRDDFEFYLENVLVSLTLLFWSLGLADLFVFWSGSVYEPIPGPM